MKRVLKRIGTALLSVVIALLLAPIVLPPFLDRIYYRGPVSAHFDGTRFFNPEGEHEPATRRRAPSAMMLRFLMGKGRAVWPDRVPVRPIKPEPRVADMRVVWVGHSTVLVQAAGLNILTDPIWSERAGPFGFGPKRVREPGIRFRDLPKIDLVIISHNHYDHMDLNTLKRLWDRDRPLVVTSLGNDTILRAKGISAVARDWGQSVPIRPGVRVILKRVHHWGSRWGSDRNRALWSGFTVVLPGGNLFFAGDTGWGDGGWPIDAARDGPYRLAIIPIGAFQPRGLMSSSHIGPVEAAEVFRRLGAAYGLGVHWGTFQLSSEAIDEPPRLLAKTLVDEGTAADRFRTLEVGTAWNVPPIRRNVAKGLESASEK